MAAEPNHLPPLPKSVTDCPQCGALCLGAITLPCGHLACRQCCRHLLQLNGVPHLTCRSCGQHLPLPTGCSNVSEVVRHLGTDPVVQELVQQRLLNQKHLCHNHKETAATTVCEDCHEYYCHDCRYIHWNQNMTKEHILRALPTALHRNRTDWPFLIVEECSTISSESIRSTNFTDRRQWLQKELEHLRQAAHQQGTLVSVLKELCRVEENQEQLLRSYIDILDRCYVTEGTDGNTHVFTSGRPDVRMTLNTDNLEPRLCDVRGMRRRSLSPTAQKGITIFSTDRLHIYELKRTTTSTSSQTHQTTTTTTTTPTDTTATTTTDTTTTTTTAPPPPPQRTPPPPWTPPPPPRRTPPPPPPQTQPPPPRTPSPWTPPPPRTPPPPPRRTPSPPRTAPPRTPSPPPPRTPSPPPWTPPPPRTPPPPPLQPFPPTSATSSAETPLPSFNTPTASSPPPPPPSVHAVDVMTAIPLKVFVAEAASPEEKKKPFITSIACTQDDKLVITDFNNNIVKVIGMSDPHTVSETLTLKERPRRLAVLSDGLIAVTTLERIVYVLQVSPTLAARSRIKTCRRYEGVADNPTDHTVLLACGKTDREPARVDVIERGDDVEWTVKHSIQLTQVTAPQYLCCSADGLLVSDREKNVVYVVDMNETNVVKSLRSRWMMSPRQVCVDEEANIYIVSYDDQSVLVRSKNKRWRRLLYSPTHADQGCDKPFGVCVTRSGCLVVAWHQKNSHSVIIGYELKEKSPVS